MANTKQQQDNTVDRMSQTAHDTIDRAKETASAYYERFAEKGEELMGMQEEWVETAREYVREKPLQALGIAVAAGYLLHMIFGRR